MSWSDEATIWMSSRAMNIPMHMTTNGKRSFIRSGGCWMAFMAGGLLGVHFDRHGKAGAQLFEDGAFIIKLDPDGDALDNFSEIARGIFGRQDTELRTGCRCDADDPAVEFFPAQQVDLH